LHVCDRMRRRNDTSREIKSEKNIGIGKEKVKVRTKSFKINSERAVDKVGRTRTKSDSEKKKR